MNVANVPAEQIIDTIRRNLSEIEREKNEVEILLNMLADSSYECWNWVSVKKASDMFDISVSAIYSRINAGKLSTKHIGAKIYVPISELMQTDDR